MAVAVPIYRGQDFFVPHFELKIADQPQTQEVVRDVMQVTYKDNLTDVDSFEITVNNWDADGRKLKYSDGDRFNPGKRFELWMGYYGRDKLRLMVRGEITSLRPTFPASGPPSLAVGGLNVLHTLRKEKHSEAYESMTDSEIAQRIGTRLAIDLETPNGSEESQNRYVLQKDQFDVVFLLERARRLGYDLFAEESGSDGRSQPPKVFFGRSANVRQRTYQLTYGKSLIEFQPDLSTATQVNAVKVIAWDRVNKRTIEATVTRDQIRNQGVGERGGQRQIAQSFDDRVDVVTDRTVDDPAEAQQIARERLEWIAKNMVTASGATVGLPDLRAGVLVEIDGVGTRFSGRYFVTATTHAIGDGGYTTQFECRREENDG